MNKTVRVRWCCGYYVGPMKWQGTDCYEPDVCETEFETEVDKEEWEEGLASATCPRCGAELHQGEDEPWLVAVEEQ